MSIDARIDRIVRIVRKIDLKFQLSEDSEEALWNELTRAAECGDSLPEAAEWWAHKLILSEAPDVCGADDVYIEACEPFKVAVRKIAASTR